MAADEAVSTNGVDGFATAFTIISIMLMIGAVILVLRARMHTAELTKSLVSDNNIDRGYETLARYAGTALFQTQASFLVSLVAGAFGFLVILLGVVIAIAQNNYGSAIITVASGAIIDTFAALLGAGSTRDKNYMMSFHQRLREDRHVEIAFDRLGAIKNPDKADETISQIAMHIVGMNPTDQMQNTSGRNAATADADHSQPAGGPAASGVYVVPPNGQATRGTSSGARRPGSARGA